MPEIQSLTHSEFFKYAMWVFSVLISVISALMIYIFRKLKKDIEIIVKRSESNHERLDIIEAEQNIFHKKNNAE